jgi:hypothetical protein
MKKYGINQLINAMIVINSYCINVFGYLKLIVVEYQG